MSTLPHWHTRRRANWRYPPCPWCGRQARGDVIRPFAHALRPMHRECFAAWDLLDEALNVEVPPDDELGRGIAA